MTNKITNSSKLLFEIFNSIKSETSLGAFLFSCTSAKLLSRNLKMNDEQFRSSFRSLQTSGYIKKINENQFLIAPKSHVKIRILKIVQSNWKPKQWKGEWKIIAFDIPENLKSQRNIFRSVIKRIGFIGIQNSVFISPFADFEELAKLRKDLKIEKYVSFFNSKSAQTDDDSELRRKFGPRAAKN